MQTNQIPTSEEPQTDLQKENLLGPVKQVLQTTYKAHKNAAGIVKGKIENDHYFSKKNFILQFNDKGIKTEEMFFGTVTNNKNIFDENAQLIKTIDYEPNGKIRLTRTHAFDNRGNEIETLSVQGDGTPHYRHVFVFNENNKKEEDTLYNRDEKILNRTVCTYNSNGDLLTEIKYNADGSIDNRQINTYNEAGQRVEYLTEHTREELKSFNQRATYKYNDHGDCIEVCTYEENGNLKYKSNFKPEYDKAGKRILPVPGIADLNPKAADESEEIEYDEKGNWIKKTTFYKKNPVNIFIRQFVYYTDTAAEGLPVHPLEENHTNAEIADASKYTERFSEENAKWLAEADTASDNFPFFRYYTLHFRELPSIITYVEQNIEAFILLKELKETFNTPEVHSCSLADGGERVLVRYAVTFPHNPGYIFHAINITSNEPDRFNLTGKMREHIDDDVHTSQFQLLCPCENSEMKDEFFEDELDECIEKCKLTRKPDKPVINIIETNADGFMISEYDVDDNFEIKDLDVNYGYGFEEFHKELMNRFRTGTKGLVLFHGEPGTGKTYYIRHLLRSRVANNKIVIYMPPNMVDHLVEPGFMTFLTDEVKSWSADGNFCVLLIEDAEPLLTKRREGVRIQGVTNLLNMTDGLLNDMLNLQIICTFNVGLKKIDSALLRPGRLIARKEFKPLSELDANLLAQRLGIKHHFKGPATLGEIYALRKNNNTLIHDVDAGENGSELIDELID